MKTDNHHFSIYVYLNNPHLALDDRTATGIANAMRISKDMAGAKLKEMVSSELLDVEKVGSSNVYFVKVAQQ